MNGFEVRDIPGKGRGIVALKTYQKGDVVLEEEPFVSCQYSWNKCYGYLACDHCMRPLETTEANVRRLSNNHNFVLPLEEHCPTKQWLKQMTQCADCKVHYCSPECLLEAQNKYHKAACLGPAVHDENHPINVLNETWKKMHYPPETGTVMLLVRLMAMYRQANNKEEFLQSLKSFHSDVVNVEQNIYHKMLGANFEGQMALLYSTFCKAFVGEEFAMFTTEVGFKSLFGIMGTNSQGIATSPLSKWVENVTSLTTLSEAEKQQLDDCIDEIYTKVESFAGDFLNTEGSGLYTLQSKLNHSCRPNAQSTFPYSNDIVVIKAIEPIEVGQEICISYLDECALVRSRHTRQKILKENYLFICTCALCEEQAPFDTGVTSDEDIDDEEEMEADEDCDDDDM